MMKTKDFSLRSSYFIGENKRKWQLFFVIASLLIGIAWLPTINIKADVVVQGTTLTDATYADLVRRLPEGYQIVSNERYEALSRQRAVTGFFHKDHIQNYGWLDAANHKQYYAGTVGKSLRLEALQLAFSNMGTSISYRSHVQNIGWQSWVSNGATTGTTGQGFRIEAFQLYTSGRFGIYYQGHMQGIGWGDWISSSETTLFGSYIGTTGQSRRLEAIDFILYEQMF